MDLAIALLGVALVAVVLLLLYCFMSFNREKSFEEIMQERKGLSHLISNEPNEVSKKNAKAAASKTKKKKQAAAAAVHKKDDRTAAAADTGSEDVEAKAPTPSKADGVRKRQTSTGSDQAGSEKGTTGKGKTSTKREAAEPEVQLTKTLAHVGSSPPQQAPVHENGDGHPGAGGDGNARKNKKKGKKNTEQILDEIVAAVAEPAQEAPKVQDIVPEEPTPTKPTKADKKKNPGNIDGLEEILVQLKAKEFSTHDYATIVEVLKANEQYIQTRKNRQELLDLKNKVAEKESQLGTDRATLDRTKHSLHDLRQELNMERTKNASLVQQVQETQQRKQSEFNNLQAQFVKLQEMNNVANRQLQEYKAKYLQQSEANQKQMNLLMQQVRDAEQKAAKAGAAAPAASAAAVGTGRTPAAQPDQQQANMSAQVKALEDKLRERERTVEEYRKAAADSNSTVMDLQKRLEVERNMLQQKSVELRNVVNVQSSQSSHSQQEVEKLKQEHKQLLAAQQNQQAALAQAQSDRDQTARASAEKETALAAALQAKQNELSAMTDKMTQMGREKDEQGRQMEEQGRLVSKLQQSNNKQGVQESELLKKGEEITRLRNELNQKTTEAADSTKRLQSMEKDNKDLQAKLNLEITTLRQEMASTAQGSTDSQTVLDSLNRKVKQEQERASSLETVKNTLQEKVDSLSRELQKAQAKQQDKPASSQQVDNLKMALDKEKERFANYEQEAELTEQRLKEEVKVMKRELAARMSAPAQDSAEDIRKALTVVQNRCAELEMELCESVKEKQAVVAEKEHLQQELESSAQPNGFAHPDFIEKSVSVRLVWPHGCQKSVLISGSFWGWSHPRTMRRLPVDPASDDVMQSKDSYYYDVIMIPGSYTFKFLVDGTWQTSTAYPVCDTKLGQGIKNNLIVVPEPTMEREGGAVENGMPNGTENGVQDDGPTLVNGTSSAPHDDADRELAKVRKELQAQVEKNNELRAKNYKAIEAASAVDRVAKEFASKSTAAIEAQYKPELEKQRQQIADLQAKLKAASASSKAPAHQAASNTNSTTTTIVTKHSDINTSSGSGDNQRLVVQIEQYKAALKDADAVLSELESKLAAEERSAHEREVALEAEVDRLKTTVTSLRTEVETERIEKYEVKETVLRLETTLREERQTSADLSAQAVKLRGMLKTGQEALKQEEAIVLQLQKEIRSLKENKHDSSDELRSRLEETEKSLTKEMMVNKQLAAKLGTLGIVLPSNEGGR